MWKVDIIESERGYGQKVDSVHTFDTYEEALEFVDEYNKDEYEKMNANPNIVPNWYMLALHPVKI